MSASKSNKKPVRTRKWETYQKAFGLKSGHTTTNMSSIRDLSLPQELSERCPEIEREWQDLKHRTTRVFSQPVTSDNASQVTALVDDLQDISEKQGMILKRARNISATWGNIPSPKRRKVADEISETEATVLRHRTILASSKKTICNEILSRTPPSLVLDTYFDRLMERDAIMWPASAQISREEFSTMINSSGRSSRTQSIFRSHLKRKYSDKIKTDFRGEMLWDPILGGWVPQSTVKAAHLVPISIGEYEYARMIGKDFVNQDTIFEIMWSEDNGLLLHHTLEGYLDDGTIVIVPVPSVNDITEYKMVVLYKACQNEWIEEVEYSDGRKENVFLKDLDGRRLQWLNDNRPNPTNLYLRYLFTRVIRRKALALEWEKDIEKVPCSQAWAEVGPLRHRMLKIMCEEIGDFVKDDLLRLECVLDEKKDIVSISETEEDVENLRPIAMRMAEGFVRDWMSKNELGEEEV